MRVISGSARGRKLRDFNGEDIRPTSDMVKESIFNIVQFDIEGRRVLDLFAGTGQLGLEALSRGASSAVFVDSSQDSIRLIKDNIRICGFSEASSVYRRDGVGFLSYCDVFDLIFIDPPYDTDLAEKALGRIIEFDKLNTNGIIIFETRASSITPVVTSPYFLRKDYIYGSVKVSCFSRS